MVRECGNGDRSWRAHRQNYFRPLGICWCKETSTVGGWWYRWEAVCTIHLGSYNNCNVQYGGINSALQGMSQANVNLGVFKRKILPRGYNQGSQEDTGSWCMRRQDSTESASTCSTMRLSTSLWSCSASMDRTSSDSRWCLGGGNSGMLWGAIWTPTTPQP